MNVILIFDYLDYFAPVIDIVRKLNSIEFVEDDILSFLEAQGVEASSAGEIYGAQGFGPSIYFVDPEGNRVELKRANA